MRFRGSLGIKFHNGYVLRGWIGLIWIGYLIMRIII